MGDIGSMQNFSPLGNFINSFLQQQAHVATTNIVVGANNTAKPFNQPQMQTPPPPLPQQAQQQLQNSQMLMAEMENTERAILVKDLLNLPQTLQELVSTLQNQKAVNQFQNMQTLQNLNIAQLMQLMQTNGKEALAKIMQMSGMLNKMGGTDNKQMQELQFIVNACMPNANMTNTQFIKNLILLYLPWLPIGENNNFDIEFSSSEEKEKTDETDDTITILIQTENYGNVKVLLMIEKANKIDIIVNCAKVFPKEELLQKLNESSKEFKLESKIAVNEHETIQKTELDKSRKVHMSGASVLNPYILLMAHAVIRYTIEIDKSKTLVTKRKQKSETK